MTSPRFATLLTAVALTALLAGCSSPAAKVGSLDTTVSFAAGGGKDAKEVTDSVDARAGDVISTDAKGLGEVVYPDGSLTRVGPDTEYTVVEVSDAATQRMVGSLDVGETFHKVEKLVGDKSKFEVKTPFGTAAVRGTAFSVVCTPTECQIVVIEGEVQFTTKDKTKITIKPFQRLIVPGQDEATVFPVDAVLADEWLASNLDRSKIDAEALGAETPGALSLAGDWKYSDIVTSSEINPDNVGRTAERDWTMSLGECNGSGCSIDIVSSSGATPHYVFEGTNLAFRSTGKTGCYNTDTGELFNAEGFDYTLETVLDLTSALVDGTITGQTTYTIVPNELCPNPIYTSASEINDVTLTRK